jgi:Rha family phage regulatory protein
MLEQTITTLEIAEMMGVEHSKILRKLEGDSRVKGILAILSEAKIGVADYFQESTYLDAQGKNRKCYKVTKMGCDFLANKFTGEKGVLFTAKYVKRFAEMQNVIQNNLLDGVSDELKAIIMQDKRMNVFEGRIENLENTMNIDYEQQQTLNNLVSKTVIEVLGGKDSNAYKEIGKKVFAECNKDYKNYFKINSRANTPRLKFEEAKEYIEHWQPCNNTKLLIKNCNSQLGLFID